MTKILIIAVLVGALAWTLIQLFAPNLDHPVLIAVAALLGALVGQFAARPSYGGRRY